MQATLTTESNMLHIFNHFTELANLCISMYKILSKIYLYNFC